MKTTTVTVTLTRTTSDLYPCAVCGLHAHTDAAMYCIYGVHGTTEEGTDFMCLDCLLDKPVPLIFIEEDIPLLQKGMKKKSQREEKRTAKAIGGKAQPASGALPWAKGDVQLKGIARIEEKFTYADSYRVTRKDLYDIRSYCKDGESPAFVVKFKDRVTDRNTETWALIPWEDYEELIRARQNRRP
jgi:hypothetical protein